MINNSPRSISLTKTNFNKTNTFYTDIGRDNLLPSVGGRTEAVSKSQTPLLNVSQKIDLIRKASDPHSSQKMSKPKIGSHRRTVLAAYIANYELYRGYEGGG